MTSPQEQPFRSGFVGLAGVPNSGKSTLLNRLVGQKVSIVSRAPQTTRHRICGIVTEPGMQLVLVDVPGILTTKDLFNKNLVASASEALSGCDLMIHLRSPDTTGGEDEARVVETLRSIHKPTFEVWNKTDTMKPRKDLPSTGIEYVATFSVSARTGRGIENLKKALAERLPPGPQFYPEDEISDRDLRFLAAEIVREKLFLFLRQELPYGIATFTESWEERAEGKTYVQVTIQTERAAHKQIIIGEGGKLLKKVGSAARPEIEELCGGPVFLELFVRVMPDWRKNPEELERLGLRTPR